MGVNSFEYFGEKLFDISEDTVTEDVLPVGVTAHDANGDPITGKRVFVDSVNGKTGTVVLKASDVQADPEGTATTAVSTHNTNTEAHNDLRIELTRLKDIVNDLLDSEDPDLDELHEIVAYIKSNKTLIDAITTSKVSVSDIINNVTTNVTNKPLSAAQGVVLKGLIDGLTSGKLDASALSTAINQALAEAKASGQFDGKPGKDGTDGTDGTDGVGIADSEINADGELVLTYTDGNEHNVGKVKGNDGVLTPDQEELLAIIPTLKDWYDESHYKTMIATISPSSSTFEIGSKNTVSFSWSFTVDGEKATLSSLKFRGIEKSLSAIGESVKDITSNSSYEVEGTRANGKKETATAKANVYFYNKYYFGCDVDPQISPTSSTKDLEYSNFIKGSNGWNGLKLKSDWANNRKTFTYTPNCPDGSYIWYAYPKRLGTSTFKMNGLPADFNVQTILFTNSTEKYTEEYFLYRSIEPSLGSIEIQIL